MVVLLNLSISQFALNTLFSVLYLIKNIIIKYEIKEFLIAPRRDGVKWNFNYQIRHFSDSFNTISPERQPNALINSFEFVNAPLTRKRIGVMGSSLNDLIIHESVCDSHKLCYLKKKPLFETFTLNGGMSYTYMTKRYKKQLFVGEIFEAR